MVILSLPWITKSARSYCQVKTATQCHGKLLYLSGRPNGGSHKQFQHGGRGIRNIRQAAGGGSGAGVGSGGNRIVNVVPFCWLLEYAIVPPWGQNKLFDNCQP